MEGLRCPGAANFGFADSLAGEFADLHSCDRRSGGPVETRAALPGVVQSSTNAVTQDVVFEGGKHQEHAAIAPPVDVVRSSALLREEADVGIREFLEAW